MEESKSKFEWSGPKSLKRAKSVLSGYELDGRVKKIQLEVVEVNEPYEGVEEQTPQTGHTPQSRSENNSSDGRELKGIKAGTSHHRVLAVIDELSSNGGVSSSDVDEALDMPYGTITGALRQLYDRRLLDREQVSQSGETFYVYTVTTHGSAELNRLS